MSFATVKLLLKKKSPEIFLVSGVVGIVGSTVLACRASSKISKMLDSAKEDMEAIKLYREENPDCEEYTEEMAVKEIGAIKIKAGLGIAKTFALPLTMSVLSLTAIFASHSILKKRNIALVAAYTSLDKGFKEYKERVKTRFGEEIEKEIRYNVTKEKIEVEEDGKKVKKEVNVSNDDNNTFSITFDEHTSSIYDKDSNLNLMTLEAQQMYANQKLRAIGYVFLNDVLEELGMEKTRYGQTVGWTYDPNNEMKIDFGIFQTHVKSDTHRGGYNIIYKLDFNVDGDILNTFEEKRR